MPRFRVLPFFAPLLSVACGGATPEPQTTASPEPVASTEPVPSAAAPPSAAPAPTTATDTNPEFLSLAENVDFCVRLHEQVVPCAGEFIDLNMELRSQYFPDFAAAAKDPAKKAELRRIGIEEVHQDGAGPLEPRKERCTGYAEHGPPTPRSAVATMEACYAKPSCAEKVACMRPVLEKRYGERAGQGREVTSTEPAAQP